MLKELTAVLGEFSWISTLIRLFLSAFLGGIIGYERGKHGRAAGFRTHIILCVGSALTSLCGIHFAQTLMLDVDATRIASSVISGIGFLGAGAIILKNNVTITGLTTAAGMWTTAAIGVACGAGFYSGAIIATVILYCATTFFTMFEKSRKAIANFHIEIEDSHNVNKIVSEIKQTLDNIIDIQIQESKTNIDSAVALIVTTDNSKKKAEDLLPEITKIDGILFALIQ